MDYRYNPFISLQTNDFIISPWHSSEAGTLRFSVVNKVTGERRILECGPDFWSVASLTWQIWPPVESEDEHLDFRIW
ncbi:MAG: hypothetical protein QUS33_06325 [Dehalococcoidia bacterium]|nr:hypothetical protein [Dehalococcoidia bacterium]